MSVATGSLGDIDQSDVNNTLDQCELKAYRVLRCIFLGLTQVFGLSQVVGLATRFYLARIVLFWLVEDLLFSFL